MSGNGWRVRSTWNGMPMSPYVRGMRHRAICTHLSDDEQTVEAEKAANLVF